MKPWMLEALVAGAVAGTVVGLGTWAGASFWPMVGVSLCLDVVLGPAVARWARTVTTKEPRPTHDDI